jgi:hypothetical protein
MVEKERYVLSLLILTVQRIDHRLQDPRLNRVSMFEGMP